MNTDEAINQLKLRCRDIVTYDYAKELVRAFGLKAVSIPHYTIEDTGADWTRRAEYTSTGEAVDICRLANLIADRLDAPKPSPGAPDPSNYMGVGKSAEASTMRAVDRLEQMYYPERFSEMVLINDERNTLG